MSDEGVDAGFRGLFTKLAGDVSITSCVGPIRATSLSDVRLQTVVFQDMEISAGELRTILNKIVAKREFENIKHANIPT